MSLGAKLFWSNIILTVFMYWIVKANDDNDSVAKAVLDRLGGILLLIGTPLTLCYWIWS